MLTNMRACKRAVGGVSPKPYLTVKRLTHTHSSWRMQPSEVVLPCKRKRRPAARPGDAPTPTSTPLVCTPARDNIQVWACSRTCKHERESMRRPRC